MGHSGDGFVLASTMCKYDLRKGDLFVLSVYVGGYGGLSESGLCVFCKWCPVCFLVVGKGPSVLL